MDKINHHGGEDAALNLTETSFSSVAEHDKLKVELESIKQKSYQLQCRLEREEIMTKQLQESNELLKEEIANVSSEKAKTSRRLLEEFRKDREFYETLRAEYNERIDDFHREIRNLGSMLWKSNEEDASLSPTQLHLNVEHNKKLEKQVKELESRVQDETDRCKDIEKAIEDLKTRYSELQNLVEDTRKSLREKGEALENAREDLALLRAQLNTPKPGANEKSSKGNSLFAEVEDSRKHTIDKFAALKSKHMEAKQACRAKMEEIKMLRVERAAMLNKWEHDFLDSKANSEKSLNEYKSNITELEKKLGELIKKNSQFEEPWNDKLSNYECFLNILRSKKQEVENLQIQINDLSSKLLVQEEAKLNTEKEMRFWRYKASCLEVQRNLSKMELLYGVEEGCKRELVTEETPDTAD